MLAVLHCEQQNASRDAFDVAAYRKPGALGAYKGRPVGGPAALSRIDRDTLDQPGVNTVMVYEGLEGTRGGRGATDLTSNGFTQLRGYLKAYNINVIVPSLTPCTVYGGDSGGPCRTRRQRRYLPHEHPGNHALQQPLGRSPAGP